LKQAVTAQNARNVAGAKGIVVKKWFLA